MELVSKAIAFAVRAHDGMRRKKSNTPYILHPLEAAVIVGSMTDDENVIAAAVLHDVVEDADITLREVETRFGRRVRELVEAETEDKREDLPPEDTWRIRKEETLKALRETDDTDIMMLWIGDKLANMRSIYRDHRAEGDALWQHFNQKDPKEQAWYYTTVAELTKQLKEYPAWIEYKTLTELVFGKGN